MCQKSTVYRMLCSRSISNQCSPPPSESVSHAAVRMCCYAPADEPCCCLRYVGNFAPECVCFTEFSGSLSRLHCLLKTLVSLHRYQRRFCLCISFSDEFLAFIVYDYGSNTHNYDHQQHISDHYYFFATY